MIIIFKEYSLSFTHLLCIVCTIPDMQAVRQRYMILDLGKRIGAKLLTTSEFTELTANHELNILHLDFM